MCSCSVHRMDVHVLESRNSKFMYMKPKELIEKCVT